MGNLLQNGANDCLFFYNSPLTLRGVRPIVSAASLVPACERDTAKKKSFKKFLHKRRRFETLSIPFFEKKILHNHCFVTEVMWFVRV
ncbi:MAG TPA: hypothetical protein PKC67_11425, partial [Kiritimatiellia bacterium]|nr:hypothetical protein [Kiritimatiellia bacterium]HMP34949.1 hypothetical protein [Kiritimatiellia bacterium]